jgi:beta-glucosidase/6-phospho-beta-glucosidase/beta-galactosidase
MKFGLVEIDRENGLQRRVRPSARYYAQVCKENAVDAGGADGLAAEGAKP